jgi:hypothetical protein
VGLFDFIGGKKDKFPSQDIVARRALCLGALIMRGVFEQGVQQFHEMELTADALVMVREKHAELVGNVKRWLSDEGLTQHQSDEEKRLFSISVGQWEHQDIINVSWRTQSLAVLLWALSVIDAIPPYDEEIDDKPILKKIELFKPSADFFVKIKLRNKEQLEKARSVAELWHWRARTTQLLNLNSLSYESDTGAGLTFKQVIKIASEKGSEAGDLPKPMDGDFPAFGKAYKYLDEHEYSLATSISMERHFALNWLCGYSADWDETPTDT